jgi:uncharacterized protein (TIGR03437 family)
MILKSNPMKHFAALLLLTAPAFGAAQLGLTATTVGPIYTVRGGNAPAQTVQAYNLGDGSLNLTATSSAPWLSATVGARTSCSQPGGGCYQVTINSATASLTPGKYTEWITLTDPKAVDSPQDIMVTVDTTGVPDSFNLYATVNGGPLAQLNIPVQSTGSGIRPTVNVASGGGWLSFNSGNLGIVNLGAPWFLQVNVRPGQATGTYQGTIQLTGSSVAAENKTVNVTLNVTSNPIIDTSAYSTIRLTAGAGTTAKVAGSVAFANLGSGSLSVTGATASGNKAISASVSNNAVQIAADPTGLAVGVYSGSVTIASNAANNAQVSVPVELTVVPVAPLVSAGGIVNISDYQNDGVAPGDIAAVFGLQFSSNPALQSAPGVPLPTSLGGTYVQVNGNPVPLYYVLPGQIAFQVPYSLSAGSATVQVMVGSTAGNLRSVKVSARAPKLLAYPTALGTYGIFINLDASLTWPPSALAGCNCRPAKVGDTVILFGIGFGQTTPAAVEGAAGAAQSIGGATVSFGGIFGGMATTNSSFTGLTPGLVGLYQMNVTIPTGTPTGSLVPVQVNVNGVNSNIVNIAISN